MKLQLHLEFESIAEMQDWIVREAATVKEWLTHATDEITSIAEMQDWIVREAAAVPEEAAAVPEEAAAAEGEEILTSEERSFLSDDEKKAFAALASRSATAAPVDDIPQVTMSEENPTGQSARQEEAVPVEKPVKNKRRRRTKAQMAEARAAAGPTPDVQPKRTEVDERANLPAKPLSAEATLTPAEKEQAAAVEADLAKREANATEIRRLLALNQEAVVKALDANNVPKFTLEPLDMQAKILAELAPLKAAL